MNTRFFPRASNVVAAATLLAGCGGSQSLNSPPVAMPQSQSITTHAVPGSLSMSPDFKSADLLYVTDVATQKLDVLSYPQGVFLGTFSSGLLSPAGECVDSAGDVYVANKGMHNVLIYDRGSFGPPTAVKDPGYQPEDCSIDPTTGDLAVSNSSTPDSGPGSVALYTNFFDHPKIFKDPSIDFFAYCGYDGKGNLFVNGNGKGGSAVVLAELAKGSRALVNITVDRTLGSLPGPVKWDGGHIALDDPANRVMYQLEISGTHAKVVGSTTFKDPAPLFDFSIVQSGKGRVLIGPATGGSGDVLYWNYPAGGSAFMKIGGFSSPFSAVVSSQQK
jgi:hypothetical protein